MKLYIVQTNPIDPPNPGGISGLRSETWKEEWDWTSQDVHTTLEDALDHIKSCYLRRVRVRVVEFTGKIVYHQIHHEEKWVGKME